MIIGLGSDLCNIERIQKSLDRFGERFEKRVFTELERAKAARRPYTKLALMRNVLPPRKPIPKRLELALRRVFS